MRDKKYNLEKVGRVSTLWGQGISDIIRHRKNKANKLKHWGLQRAILLGHLKSVTGIRKLIHREFSLWNVNPPNLLSITSPNKSSLAISNLIVNIIWISVKPNFWNTLIIMFKKWAKPEPPKPNFSPKASPEDSVSARIWVQAKIQTFRYWPVPKWQSLYKIIQQEQHIAKNWRKKA